MVQVQKVLAFLCGIVFYRCLVQRSCSFLLIGAEISQAASDVVNCDGCNSVQKSNEAVGETESGRVYVTDRTNDTISAYDVVVYTEFNPPASVAIPTSTPGYIAGYYYTLIGQFHTAQGPGVNVPSSVGGSAHDLVGSGQLQAEVGLWLLGVFFESPTSGGQTDEDLEKVRDEILGREVVKAIFSDGSTAIFSFMNYAGPGGQFNFVDDSLLDSQLNPIPDAPNDILPGSHGSFGGLGGTDSRDDFVETLQLLGIGVSGDTSGGGQCSTFTCSATPGGVECVFTVGSC